MVDPDWLPTGQASVLCAHVLVRTHTWSVVTCEAEVLGTALDRLLFPLLLRPPPGENEVHQTRGQQPAGEGHVGALHRRGSRARVEGQREERDHRCDSDRVGPQPLPRPSAVDAIAADDVAERVATASD